MANSTIPERVRLEQGIYNACVKSAEGADLLISAFVAALRSRRPASVCAPYPRFLINNVMDKDFKSADRFVAHFPLPRKVASNYDGSEGALNPFETIPLQALMLLHWILQFRHHVELVQDANEISGLLSPNILLGSSNQDVYQRIYPSHVLKIQEVEPSGVINLFEAAKTRHGSIMAFHGTRAESLHGILRCGLLNMSKTFLQQNGAMHGEGVYLSTDIGVANTFSTYGDTWESSCLGHRVRYVLLCEVANGDEGTSLKMGMSESGANRPARNSGGGLLNAYVVKNVSLIRIRYVLVYCDYSRASAEVTISSGRFLKDSIVNMVDNSNWICLPQCRQIISYASLFLIIFLVSFWYK